LTLIILIPLHFAFWATFCRHVIVTEPMLPLGYESSVTEGNEMQGGGLGDLCRPFQLLVFESALRQGFPFGVG
jgi:hypothetical protein